MLRLENIEPAETLGEPNDMVAGQGPSMTFYVPEGDQTTQLAGQIAVVRESSLDTDAAAAMSFWTAANDASPTEKMRITSAGKVGIGTTSPSTVLEVAGIVTVTGNDKYITFDGGNKIVGDHSTDCLQIRNNEN